MRLLSLLMIMLLCGCTSFQNFLFGTPEQRAQREREQREAMVSVYQFDTPYEVVFRSAIRALVDLGFRVRRSDINSGLISVSIEDIHPAYGYEYLSLWSMSAKDASQNGCNIGNKQEMTVLVDKISEQTTEVNIKVLHADYIEEVNGQVKARPLAWHEGINNKKIFDAILEEVARRGK